jgi:hypothetical protein
VLPIASTNGSFTKVFSPAGAIRATPSKAGAGTVHSELRKGSISSFDTACHDLASGRPLAHP